MKKLILTLAFSATCASALAQGALNFANLGAGANAPVTDLAGYKLNGPGFLADLYWAPGTVVDSSVLNAVGQPSPFWTNGYFCGGERIIPLPGGTLITAQVRVWDTGHGSTWPQASMTPGAWLGKSALFQLSVACVSWQGSPPCGSGAPWPPPTLTSLQPFSVGEICLSCPPPHPPPPQLCVTTQPNSLFFSWPAYFNGPGYQLQENQDLNSTNWVTITNKPVLVGLADEVQYQLSTRLPTGTIFYRLRGQ